MGYFCRNSLITFKDFKDAEFIFAIITGKQFKVTQDASFGNRGSKTITHHNITSGNINRKNFPFIIAIDKALNIIQGSS